MIDLESNVHRLIAAPTGAGKSHFVGWIAEQLYERGKRWIILDTKTKNHIGLISLRKVKLLKIKPDTAYNFWKLVDYDYILCIPTKKTKTRELIEQYRMILDVLFSAQKPVTIFVEEAHNYNPNNYVADDLLELIAREGRGLGISAYFITQSIQEFPKILWRQCKLTYLFKFMIPQDVNYIAKMIPDFEKLNRQLQLYDVIEYNHITNEYKIIKSYEIVRKTKHYG